MIRYSAWRKRWARLRGINRGNHLRPNKAFSPKHSNAKPSVPLLNKVQRRPASRISGMQIGPECEKKSKLKRDRETIRTSQALKY